MKRINSIINVKETVELEKAVANELNNGKNEKSIASVLAEESEDDDENSEKIHRDSNT